jgi:hypothetical protein
MVYQDMKRWRRLLVTALLLFLSGYEIISVIIHIQSRSDANYQGFSERSGNYGHWKYRARIDQREKRIVADFAYQLDTAIQVDDFVSTQQSLARELVAKGLNSIDGTIVFRGPLIQPAFEEFVRKHGLMVSDYTLRLLDKSGQRITAVGSPADNTLVPSAFLHLLIADIEKRVSGSLLGWVEVRATMPAEAYDRIAHDDSVYVVDVSRSVVRTAFQNDPRARMLPVEVLEHQLYWKLEDLHLVPR